MHNFFIYRGADAGRVAVIALKGRTSLLFGHEVFYKRIEFPRRNARPYGTCDLGDG